MIAPVVLFFTLCPSQLSAWGSPGDPIVCGVRTETNKSIQIEWKEGRSEKLCQIDRLGHVTSWLRNHSSFQGLIGQVKGRPSVSYFPEGASYPRWSGLLSPCDAEWLGLIAVSKAGDTDMIVPGPTYKGKIFVERPTYNGYKGWGCADGKSLSHSGTYCETDSSVSSGLIQGDRVLWVGEVVCQRGTPVPEDVFSELISLSQSEFPDVCKVDGVALNQCEQESIPQPLDVAWIDVGRSHKVLMREHKTKWVQESSAKDFVCFKVGQGPCSKQEEDDCMSKGNCHGDEVFCRMAGCSARMQDNQEGCRCELLQKPGEIIVNYGGVSVRPTCYGFSRMMATLEVHKPDRELTGCTGCHLECIEGGVKIVTLTSELRSATVCASHFCASAKGGSKTTDILFHTGALVGPKSIRITGQLLDGSKFSFDGHCIFPDGCMALDCTFCKEFLRNPQCYPVKKWLFLVVVVMCCYCALMLLTNILRAIGVWGTWVFAPIKLVLALGLRLAKLSKKGLVAVVTRGQMIVNDELHQIRVERGEQNEGRLGHGPRGPVRHWLYSPALILILTTSICSGCDELVYAESKSITCKSASGNEKECSVTGRALLPAVNPGQEACLHFSMPGSPDSKCLKIKVKSINLRCKQASSYYVPEAKARCTSVRRCRWAGDCQSGCPTYFSSNSFSDDWANRMDRAGLGMSGCSDGCGGAACGCFNAAPSCIFWRKWVENPSNRVWKVSPCASWVLAAIIELTLPSGEVKTLEPVTGQATQMFKGVAITYLGSSIEIVGMTRLCEMKEMGTGIMALAPCNDPGHAIMGNVGEIQCSSIESAKHIRSDGCIWNADLVGIELRVDDAVCFSKLTSVEAVANFSKIPAIISGVRFDQGNHGESRIYGSPLDITKVSGEFSVSFRGMRLKLSEISASCTGEITNVSGCYSCMTGASVSIKLHSSKNTTGHLKCDSDETAFSVMEGTHTYRPHMSFDKAVVDEECVLNCGGHSSKLLLKGSLVFMDVPRFVDGSYVQTYHSKVPAGGRVPNPVDWLNALFGDGITRWILGIIGVLLACVLLFVVVVAITRRLIKGLTQRAKVA
nr:glycoprotein polyprotein [Heartland virus]WIF20424.1 glycoprotein polyprotein [Heartland virus]BCU92822.1 membrane glycoprotein polyprotein [Heartland virus]